MVERQGQQGRQVGRNRMILTAVLVSAVGAFGAAAGRSYYHPGYNLYSPQDDVKLGQQAEQQALQQLPIVHDSATESYVTALGKKLAAKMPGPEFPYRFHVVQQNAINAFAVPGGAVFVNTGTICAAGNEAQLAGVMAHEESHVALRHSTSMASKQAIASVPLGILGAILGNGMGGQLARIGAQIGIGSVFMHYSRSMESQADALGAQVMNAAGYDPRQMAAFFDKLKQQGGSRTAQFLSDHPDPGNRQQAIDAEIPTLGSHPTYVDDTTRFHQIQSRVCSGTASRSGNGVPTAQNNGIQNNGGEQQAAFQGITLRFPRTWHAYGDATSQLTLAPPNGVVTQRNEGAVITGVIVSVFQPAHPTSLDAGAEELIAFLQQSNPQLRRLSERHQSVRTAGIEGDAIQLSNRNLQGQMESDHLIVFPRSDGTILYFIFIAPSRTYGSVAPTFDRILGSVQVTNG